MFSRALFSTAKGIGQRRYLIGDQSLKLVEIGSTREMSRGLSQLLRQGSKREVLALYDVATSKAHQGLPRFYEFCDGEPFSSLKQAEITETLRRFPVDGSSAGKQSSLQLMPQGDNSMSVRVVREMEPDVDKFWRKSVCKRDVSSARTESVAGKISRSFQPRDWTIPALLLDKKPKLLHEFEHQRRKSISEVFTKIFGFGTQDSQYAKTTRNYRNKFTVVKDQAKDQNPKGVSSMEIEKLFSQVRDEDFTETKSLASAATDTLDFVNEPVAVVEEDEVLSDSDDRRTFSLSSLVLGREVKPSSSLKSFHLDWLFDIGEPVDDFPATAVYFAPKDSGCGSKSSIMSKLEDFCKKRKERKGGDIEDICKKRKQSNAEKKDGCGRKEEKCRRAKKPEPCKKDKPPPSSCGKEKKQPSPCGKEKKPPSSCGKEKKPPSSCGKEKKPPSSCGKEKKPPSPCGKEKKPPSSCGKEKKAPSSCGKEKKAPSPCGKDKKEDPCKPKSECKGSSCTKGHGDKDPCRDDKRYPPCKGDDKKDDPCKNYRNEAIHGPSCKERKDQCGKRKPGVCQDKPPGGHGSKKADCTGPKNVSCAGAEKMADCAGPKNGPSEGKDKKAGDCPGIRKIEPCEKKECPPVIRAPGCPNEERKKKKDEGEGPGSCQGFTAVPIGLRGELFRDSRSNWKILRNFLHTINSVPDCKREKSTAKYSSVNGREIFTMLYGGNL